MSEHNPVQPNPFLDFQVPEHVANELGAIAGSTSTADELLDVPPEEEPAPTELRDEQMVDWAESGISDAIRKWTRAVHPSSLDGDMHFEFKDMPPPTDFKDLAAGHPTIEKILPALWKAKNDLTAFSSRYDAYTEAGENIGDTMKLVLLPWGVFRDGIQSSGDLPRLYYTMVELGIRSLQMQQEIAENIGQQNVFYDSRTLYPDSHGSFSPNDYLQEKISRDGNWGIMLMQTSAEPGWVDPDANSLLKMSSRLTLEEASSLRISGHNVAKFGIFEALAYLLQESQLIETDQLWLPANSFGPHSDIPNPNKSHMPRSFQLAGWVIRGKEKRRVRLAVSDEAA